MTAQIIIAYKTAASMDRAQLTIKLAVDCDSSIHNNFSNIFCIAATNVYVCRYQHNNFSQRARNSTW